MINFKSLLRESVTVIFFTALIVSGWETALAAGSMSRMLSSFGSWIGFTVYSLGGFIILSAIFLAPGLVTGLITGIFKRNWDRSSIRRFLLAAALGTSFILIVVLLKPSLIFSSTSGLRGFKGLLLAGGLVVISYLVGTAISYGALQIFEMKNARGQWSFTIGFWFFLVSVPPIAALIWGSPIEQSFLKFVIFLAVAGIGLFIAIWAVPKLYDLLNKGSSIRWSIPVAVLIIIYLITLPRHEKVFKGEPADSEHPPIVLLTVDTLRPDALDCYPTGIAYRLGTPNIKRLADEGALFENAYSTTPWTLSSVASFLSGLPPTAHGAVNSKNAMTQGATTLAEILKESGYATGAIVVNGLLGPWTGVSQGFDTYDEVTDILRDSRKLLFQKLFDRIRLTMPEPAMPNFNPVMENYAVDRTVQFIQDHRGERFFLWIHLLAPHGTYYPPKEYRDRIERELGISVPKKEIYTQAQLKLGTVPITPSVLNGILALYAGEVAFVDDNVGRVISALEDSGIFDECLFVFSADHGEEFFEHDRQAHAHSLYPELLHVPLIFRWPEKIEKGRRIDMKASLVDLTPSILDLIDVKPEFKGAPAEFMSRSVAPLITGHGAVPEIPIFVEDPLLFDQAIKGVIVGNLYYIGGDGAVLHPRLYDLSDDPGALYDILPEKRNDAYVMSKMLEEYEKICSETADRLGTGAETDMMEQFKALGYLN